MTYSPYDANWDTVLRGRTSCRNSSLVVRSKSATSYRNSTGIPKGPAVRQCPTTHPGQKTPGLNPPQVGGIAKNHLPPHHAYVGGAPLREKEIHPVLHERSRSPASEQSRPPWANATMSHQRAHLSNPRTRALKNNLRNKKQPSNWNRYGKT